MQIVIDINENDYKTLMINSGNCSISMAKRIVDSVFKGKKLPNILDKVRAEIIELRSKQNVGVLECLDIIDKYRIESEGKEEKR